MTLSTIDTRDGRLLILLIVLILHFALILLIIRAARQPFLVQSTNSSLELLWLPNAGRAPSSSPPQPRLSEQLPSRIAPPAPSQAALDDSIRSTPQEEAPQPRIDWEQEAEGAAQDALANGDKERAYRDLSALSPEQLRWVRENRFEPAPPGIAWTYRRIEITKEGIPIIHINDHCIAIPIMMMMVFCHIGHIEPKGDLFEHMRDPHKP